MSCTFSGTIAGTTQNSSASFAQVDREARVSEVLACRTESEVWALHEATLRASDQDLLMDTTKAGRAVVAQGSPGSLDGTWLVDGLKDRITARIIAEIEQGLRARGRSASFEHPA